MLFVSIATFAEIRFGIERAADATHRAELRDWLTHELRPMFEARVLPVSEDVMFRWCYGGGWSQGRTYLFATDLIIAATALHHGLTVVSRDTTDCNKGRVPVLNPWRDPF